MIDLPPLPPVFGEGISERMFQQASRQPPEGVHLVFAGPDEPFLKAVRDIYQVKFGVREFMVCREVGRYIIAIPPAEKADGLVLDMRVEPDGHFRVQPMLMFSESRMKGCASRIRDDEDHPDRLKEAFESLIFRRVLRAERVS